MSTTSSPDGSLPTGSGSGGPASSSPPSVAAHPPPPSSSSVAPNYKSAKGAPLLLPDGSWESYEEELDAWVAGSEADPKKLAANVVGIGVKNHPLAKRVALALWRKNKAQYQQADGLPRFLRDMRRGLKVGAFNDTISRVLSWLRCQRGNSEEHADFIERYKRLMDDLDRDKCKLIENVETPGGAYLANVLLYAGLRLRHEETDAARPFETGH